MVKLLVALSVSTFASACATTSGQPLSKEDCKIIEEQDTTGSRVGIRRECADPATNG